MLTFDRNANTVLSATSVPFRPHSQHPAMQCPQALQAPLPLHVYHSPTPTPSAHNTMWEYPRYVHSESPHTASGPGEDAWLTYQRAHMHQQGYTSSRNRHSTYHDDGNTEDWGGYGLGRSPAPTDPVMATAYYPVESMRPQQYQQQSGWVGMSSCMLSQPPPVLQTASPTRNPLTYTVPMSNHEMGTYVWEAVDQVWRNRRLGHTHRSIYPPTNAEFDGLFHPRGDPDPNPPSIIWPIVVPTPRCGICDEEGTLVASRQPRSNENFQELECRDGPHEFCDGCLTAWIHAQVSTGKTGIKCPADGCTYRLSKLDVERLGASSDVTRFQELLGADIAGKTRDLLADPVQAQWLRHNTKKCPTCSQLIEREQGCDAMMCLCGTEFCYSCGQRTDQEAYILWPRLRERCSDCTYTARHAARREAARLRRLQAEVDAASGIPPAESPPHRHRTSQPSPPPGMPRPHRRQRRARAAASDTATVPSAPPAPPAPVDDEWVSVGRHGRAIHSVSELTPERPQRRRGRERPHGSPRHLGTSSSSSSPSSSTPSPRHTRTRRRVLSNGQI